MAKTKRWTPDTWRGKPIRQVPEYTDAEKLAEVEGAPIQPGAE